MLNDPAIRAWRIRHRRWLRRLTRSGSHKIKDALALAGHSERLASADQRTEAVAELVKTIFEEVRAK